MKKITRYYIERLILLLSIKSNLSLKILNDFKLSTQLQAL